MRLRAKHTALMVCILFALLCFAQSTLSQTSGDIKIWRSGKFGLEPIRDTLTIVVNLGERSAVDSVAVWRIKKSGITIIGAEAKRRGGTSATVNVRKNATDMFSNYATTTTWATMGTVTGGALSINDSVTVCLRAISGTCNEVVVQLTYVKALR